MMNNAKSKQMNKVMLLYPPGKPFQRGEDRAQSNIEQSAANTMHACNDLGYCAAVLKRGGYEVFLRDYQTRKATLSNVLNDVLTFKPDIIFLSTTNATLPDDLHFIAKIQRVYRCTVFLKGAIFYDTPQSALDLIDLEHITCLIGGEVEFIILPLVNYYLKGEGKLEEIDGIIYNKNGAWVKTAFRCRNEDLDSLPFPDRSLMQNELYVRPDTGEPMATISVARGCPSQCVYCLTPIISGKKVRFRSVENVFAEIEECYYRYGIHNFFFKADTFTINQKWAIELCERIIHSDLNGIIAFTANARADCVSPELLAKMKQAGCFMIAVGFESGSERSLRLMKKGTTVAQNLAAARNIRNAGIPLFAFFMIGLPWETREDIHKTVEHIFQINPDFIELHIAMPFYGTELYELCQSSGVLTAGAYGFDYYSPNTAGSAYCSLEQIQHIKKKNLLRFYTRPAYMAQKLWAAAQNPTVLKNYGKYGWRLLKNTLWRS